jgi:hypothetical protein
LYYAFKAQPKPKNSLSYPPAALRDFFHRQCPVSRKISENPGKSRKILKMKNKKLRLGSKMRFVEGGRGPSFGKII